MVKQDDYQIRMNVNELTQKKEERTMCADGKTGTTESLKGILQDAAGTIRSAKDCLGKAKDAALGDEPQMIEQIRVECTSLDAFLAQLTEARSTADDALFSKAAGAVKLQVPSLQASSDRIKEMASGTKPTPGVVGYMDEAVTFIAQALAFVAELP
jgi:hypothetical protein